MVVLESPNDNSSPGCSFGLSGVNTSVFTGFTKGSIVKWRDLDCYRMKWKPPDLHIWETRKGDSSELPLLWMKEAKLLSSCSFWQSVVG